MRKYLDIHQAFYEASQQWPNRIALSDQRKSFTYKEAFLQIKLRGHFLESYLKCKTGSKIGIFADNGCYSALWMLACVQKGYTYVPISYRMSTPMLEEQLEQLPCDLIIYDSNLINDENRKVFDKYLTGNLSVPFDIDVAKIEKDTEADFFQEIDPLLTAYILWTSGSSGKQKAVQVSRRNLESFLGNVLSVHKFSAEDEFLSFSRLTFDLSVFDHFVPFQVGAGLHFIQHEHDYLNPIPFLESRRITVALLVPSVMRALYLLYQRKAKPLLCLRKVFFCGEELRVRDIDTLKFFTPQDVEIYNWYGPTEATVACLEYKVSDLVEDPVPIGLPIGANQYQIGPENELILIGEQVSDLGYFKSQSQLFWMEKGNRFYNTGDIVELIDGQIFWKGRRDNLVKRRGYRISLEVIQEAIEKIINSKTVVIYNQQTDEIISISEGASQVDLRILMEKISTELPFYMIPSRFKAIQKFPLNERGKIDSRALKNMYID